MKISSNKIRCSIFIISAFLILSLSSPEAHADYWGSNIIGSLLGANYTIMYDEMYGAMIAAVKNAAAQVYNSTVEELISGGGNDGSDGSSAMFITNWNDFLYVYPEKNAKLVMNDFFSTASQGKSSSYNYKSSSGSSISGNYTNQMQKVAKQQIGLEASSNQSCSITDSSTLFQDGDWKAYNSLYSSASCNQFGYTLATQSLYSDINYQLSEEAKTKAIAYQGYKPKTSGGNVITPGSTIKDMETLAKDLPNKIMAGAKKIPEVITALATRMATSTIRQGISNVKSNIQRETGISTTNINATMNGLAGNNPKEYFKPKF